MEGLDNGTIFKCVAAAAVAYVMYKVVIDKESFSGRKLYYSDYEGADASAYPATGTADSLTEGPQPPGWLPPMSTSVDLLPKPVVSQDDFTQYAPKDLGQMNFLSPSALVGVNTTGNRRNATRDLRGEIPCPRGPPIPAPIDQGICHDIFKRGICSQIS